MRFRKLLLLAVIAVGVGWFAAPRAEAGLSIGIGIGIPVGYAGYGPYGYPAYYAPYGYAPRGYYHRHYPRRYYRVGVRPHYHHYHGHRVVCRRVHRHWR